jgi:hypothetical protein
VSFTRFPRILPAFVLGLLCVPAIWAEEVPIRPIPALLEQSPAITNQQMANDIADRLHRSGQLQGYRIDIAYQGGLAELTGSVGSEQQRQVALRIARGVPGVEQVIDRLEVAGNFLPVEATNRPARLPSPLPESDASSPPAVSTGGAGNAKQSAEIQPIFQAPAPSPYALNPPRMPPYAWPTYAPYNNFSRVAYPEAYPYKAWPFIGPVYPFPKVPLGWRSVKLEWDDGKWWFSTVANRHGWWKLRYH